MKRHWKSILIGLVAVALVAVGTLAILNSPLYRIFVGIQDYDMERPALPTNFPHPAILVFSKSNGYHHEEAVPASIAMFEAMGRREGWSVFVTDNAAVHNLEDLSRFDAVVWTNVSGDVLTADQRRSLRTYVENGGGFVAIHGTGGDPKYKWTWFVENLIGAQFIGHPLDPRFQRATIRVEDRTHPATRMLPAEWVRTDEWYSFENSVREREGFHVLATLDERTYRQKLFRDGDISMGADHPIIWSHCEGRGRAFYSALGHRAATYSEPLHQQMLEGAVRWAARLEGEGCDERAE